MKITLEQISEITGIRISVLRFALEMERKLKLNDHKGGWKDCTFKYLTDRLDQEVVELKTATLKENKSRRAIINECVDVANFAMMISDNT